MTARGRHLRNLSEHNWFRMSTFVSASDGKGNWIFGDGTYCLRFKGKTYMQEGNKKHWDRMTEILDMLAAEERREPIPLPSNSYMKKLNAATHKRYALCKIDGHEIFVDCRLLYEMTKVLHGAKGYAVMLEGYTPANKRMERTCIYLAGDNGDGLLMPLECLTRVRSTDGGGAK